MDTLGSILLIGAGATAATDLWALARKRLLGVAAPDWAMVGRWIGHVTGGRFRHDRIAAALVVRGERAIGWTAHYAIGIAFAGALVGICGTGWLNQPTAGPALLFGIVT